MKTKGLLAIRLLKHNTHSTDIDFRSFLFFPIHLVILPKYVNHFSSNLSSFWSINCTRSRIEGILYSGRYMIRVNYLTGLCPFHFWKKKKVFCAIGKHCPSDGLLEFRFPRVESLDPSLGHCLGNRDALFLFF